MSTSEALGPRNRPAPGPDPRITREGGSGVPFAGVQYSGEIERTSMFTSSTIVRPIVHVRYEALLTQHL